MVVTAIFGAVVLYQTREGMYRTHYRVRGREAISVAFSLSSRLVEPLKARRYEAIHRELNETLSLFPDVRYAIVQDLSGQIISHGLTFPRELPPDLRREGGDLCSACHQAISPYDINLDMLEIPSRLSFPSGSMREFRNADGNIIEATVPIDEGRLGALRLGVGDRLIAHEVAATYQSMLLALAFCAVVGLLLALLLAYIIVRPVHDLVEAANRVGKGDLSARAPVFSGDEIGELATAFNQMTEGLENYRNELQEKEAVRFSLIGKIVLAHEEERKNIARELHDQLGQALSHNLLALDSLAREHPEQAARIQPIKIGTRQLIDDVRKLAWDARPSILDDYGVDHALARYVEEVSKRVDFPIDFQCAVPDGGTRMAGQYEVTLYRIAQEAVTNIIRHAKPSRASLILIQDSHEANLIIEDDGAGFSLKSLKHRGDMALGLIGMHERAALVGGELSIDSNPGQGTTVRVKIPLNGAQHADSPVDSR